MEWIDCWVRPGWVDITVEQTYIHGPLWAVVGLSGHVWASLGPNQPASTSASQRSAQQACSLHARRHIHTYIHILWSFLHREAYRSPERLGEEAQRGSERLTQAQEARSGPEKLREPQKGTETHREAQRDSERPREAQGGLHTYIHMYTHKSIERPREAERG